MIVIISPAKTLDFDSKPITKTYTIPEHLDTSEIIIKKLRTFSPKKLGLLMDISDQLSQLNAERYQHWDASFDTENAKQSILAFKGDVYLGLRAETFKEKDFAFAQKHLLILSGLHGYLRPLDLLKPYRLEMGTKLQVGRTKNLYEIWNKVVTDYINASTQHHKENTLINLASEEYFKVVNRQALSIPLLNIEFKEKKEDTYKTIGFFAKKARGLMSSYIIKNKIEKSTDLKSFNDEGYSYNGKLSNETSWIFTRDQGL